MVGPGIFQALELRVVDTAKPMPGAYAAHALAVALHAAVVGMVGAVAESGNLVGIDHPVAFGSVFILSTSIHGDSLSLWNGYSAGDDPVCIEFSSGGILSVSRTAHTLVPVGPDKDSLRPFFFSNLFEARVGRVLYDPTEQERYARKAIEQCIVYLAEPDPTLLKVAPLLVRDILLAILLFFKEPSFYHENEYRVCLIGRAEAQDLSLVVKNRVCAWSDDGSLPYIELPLRFDSKGLIRSVMSGPRLSNWASVSQCLREKIDQAGGDITAIAFPKSAIPLRF